MDFFLDYNISYSVIEDHLKRFWNLNGTVKVKSNKYMFFGSRIDNIFWYMTVSSSGERCLSLLSGVRQLTKLMNMHFLFLFGCSFTMYSLILQR